MSLLLLEGFDDGLHAERWGNVPTPTPHPSNRHGNSLQMGVFTHAGHALGAGEAHPTITLGLWRTINNLPLDNPQTSTRLDGIFFQGEGGATTHIWIALSPIGQLIVYRGAAITVELGRTDVVYPSPGTSRYLEIQVTLHDTTGSVAIWSDGIQVLNLNNIDTRNGGTSPNIDRILMINTARNNVLVNSRYDDICITNGAGPPPHNGRLGDIIAATLTPASNGHYSQFVGSDGNSLDNRLLVDELPAHDGDTTFVESVTDGQRDSYGFSDLPYSTGIIRGAQLTAVARQLGASDNIQLTTRIAGVDHDGSTIPLPGAYDAEVTRIMELSPATAAAWTIAEINAAEFGIENVI